MKQVKTLVLEPSSNTHVISIVNKNESIEVLQNKGTDISLKANKSIITHGEHGMLVTEKKYIYKTCQKELNPITKKIQDAVD